ncbi:DUF4199 domain-containing protein [Chitinophaga arvensicola]|uniref:DUF4199 domain-containing protein n=1 Tax=Chitinophaga arvensicola TaxID=29529 RepID=A0A1I0RL90_9BACT|nr:DUF4199 domain-containing protein [Chitinophaga arvensicola]SEW41890.1 Protein of unknown function [Chitinophaga arvensicola]
MQQNSNPGLKWGIIVGLAMILWNVLIWVAGPDYLFSLKLKFLQFVVWAALGILAGLEKKKQLGGYIGFKDAIKPIFTTFVISSLMMAVYNYVAFSYVADNHLLELSKQHLMEDTAWLLQKMKAPQYEIDKQLKDLKEADYRVTISSAFIDYLRNLIKFFMVSAVLAVIVRKKAPVRAQ